MLLLVLYFLAGAVLSQKTTCSYAGQHQSKCTLLWMCQERCSPFDLQANLKMLDTHRTEIKMVSPEAYQVGHTANFERATASGVPVTNLQADMAKLKVPYFPMLTSGSITDLRTLWKNPTHFFTVAVATARNHSFMGYHIDWEPESGVVAGDAKLYCEFLDKFADALHRAGLILIIDVARWSPLWDFDLLAKTRVDKIATMQSYTTDLTRFEREVSYTTSTLGNKTIIGMMSNLNGYTPSVLSSMVSILKKYHVNEINVWHDNLLLSADWLNFLKNFINS